MLRFHTNGQIIESREIMLQRPKRAPVLYAIKNSFTLLRKVTIPFINYNVEDTLFI